ncbi:bifunctional UDP-sugar hydrolase/5'-nucleotidase periplasmic precursor [Serratia plymuthica]|uniref:Bifunctional UDP-sugar hydrolase/5'-nucleotidase periplasmic n=1 Tax=Serratia plymuthica TaxID=82996 RepID=A0A2X4X1Q7_SERPL|nr:bifunctional UDP-sugar hydrolase/5'-nucleotidase periplasmic precursor [Serratia plymuthica]
MRFSLKTTACALAVSLTFLSGAASAWEKDKTYDITILHTNDHHGHFWQNDHGEYGLGAQKTLVDSIRQEVAAKGGSLLLLSGGDINTGVPESDLQDAEPDFRGMNLVGYDAMAIGNHEFDNPLSVLRQQEKWATFPLLSANIYQKSTQQRLFKPYALFDKQGIKIAVIGLTTDDTAKIGNPEYFTDIEFRVPAQEAKQVVEQLRKDEKPDVIIAATHMGHYDDGNHGSNAPGDVEMARNLPAGYLDMIVGGHSQDPVCMAGENHKQVDYVPALRVRRIAKTAPGSSRRTSGANTSPRRLPVPQRRAEAGALSTDPGQPEEEGGKSRRHQRASVLHPANSGRSFHDETADAIPGQGQGAA